MYNLLRALGVFITNMYKYQLLNKNIFDLNTWKAVTRYFNHISIDTDTNIVFNSSWVQGAYIITMGIL